MLVQSFILGILPYDIIYLLVAVEDSEEGNLKSEDESLQLLKLLLGQDFLELYQLQSYVGGLLSNVVLLNELLNLCRRFVHLYQAASQVLKLILLFVIGPAWFLVVYLVDVHIFACKYFLPGYSFFVVLVEHGADQLSQFKGTHFPFLILLLQDWLAILHALKVLKHALVGS